MKNIEPYVTKLEVSGVCQVWRATEHMYVIGIQKIALLQLQKKSNQITHTFSKNWYY